MSLRSIKRSIFVMEMLCVVCYMETEIFIYHLDKFEASKTLYKIRLNDSPSNTDSSRIT
jgi:hypothetical protein